MHLYALHLGLIPYITRSVTIYFKNYLTFLKLPNFFIFLIRSQICRPTIIINSLHTSSLKQEILPLVQASFQVKSKNNSDQTLHLGLKAKSWLLWTKKTIYNFFKWDRDARFWSLRPLKRESGSYSTGESEMKKCPKGNKRQI